MNKYLPKDRKKIPVFTGFVKYFPNAMKYVAYVSWVGNQQHHKDKPLHWDMSKSTDEPDAGLRHAIDSVTDEFDEDGVLHRGKKAWRAMAELERFLTSKEK